MSKQLDQKINSLKAAITKHAETFPDDIDAWRTRFDALRADLDRLNYARQNQPYSANTRPLDI